MTARHLDWEGTWNARAIAPWLVRSGSIDGLTERGYSVDVLAVYRTVTAEPDAGTLARVRVGDFDAVTFTSSSTVTNFADIVGPLSPLPTVVSIGPVTSASAEERGLPVTLEADPHSIEGVVEALLRWAAGAPIR